MSSWFDIPLLTTLLHLKPCYQLHLAVLGVLRFIMVITLDDDGKINMQILVYNLMSERKQDMIENASDCQLSPTCPSIPHRNNRHIQVLKGHNNQS